MRSLRIIALSLAAASLLAIHPTGQAGPPPAQPQTPPADCDVLAHVKVDGIDLKYARRRIGDKWISGCIGPAGPCSIPVYIPC